MLSWIIHIPIYALAMFGVWCIIVALDDDTPEETNTSTYNDPQWFDNY